MKRFYLLGVLGALGLGYMLATQSTPSQTQAPLTSSALVSITLPDTLSETARLGEAAFAAKCTVCHGENAVGQEGVAPPLIHKIYEPSHHGDGAFYRAVAMGVRAHHWRFGDMPKIEGLTKGDVGAIIAYIRELQRENGIL